MQDLHPIQTLFWGSLALIAYVQNSAPENFSSSLKGFNSWSILWAGSGLPEWIMPLCRGHCHACCSYSILLTANSVTVWGNQVHCPLLPDNFQTYITRKNPDPLLHLTESWELNNICATSNQSAKGNISCACFLGHSPGWEEGSAVVSAPRTAYALQLRGGACEIYKQTVEERLQPVSLLVPREFSNCIIMQMVSSFQDFHAFMHITAGTTGNVPKEPGGLAKQS